MPFRRLIHRPAQILSRFVGGNPRSLQRITGFPGQSNAEKRLPSGTHSAPLGSRPGSGRDGFALTIKGNLTKQHLMGTQWTDSFVTETQPKGSSILDLLLWNANHFTDVPAAKFKDAGHYTEVTWGELLAQVELIARGLIARGVKPGDRVVLLCETRLEWVAADLGIVAAGAVTVPVFGTSVTEEVQYICQHCEAVAVIAENPEQVAKMKSERARLPKVDFVVQVEGRLHNHGGKWVVPWEELMAEGRDVSDRALLERKQGLGADSVYTIIYTSGTTGRPKGVVTTHGSMLYVAEAVEKIDVVDETDVQLLFLPLAHVFGRFLMVAWLRTRHLLAFAQSATTLRENLLEVRPTILCGVPRVFEKLYGGVLTSSGGFGGGLYIRLISGISRLRVRRGRTAPPSWLERIGGDVFRGMAGAGLGRHLRTVLGGRIRILLSGGAPLSVEIAALFQDAGFELLEGYGLTESAAATCVGRPGLAEIGTVGQPLPGTQIRLGDDGEVFIKGAGLMRGYWNQPEASREAFDRDGWLRTGDFGVIHTSGALQITGRKKELIVTAGGKNIGPEKIEKRFRTHPLVSQLVVHGDRRKYLSALITLEPGVLRELCVPLGFGTEPYSVQTQLPEIVRYVDQLVGRLNRTLAPHETVKAFKILERDFTPDTGEVTPTLKLKRDLIYQRYERIFDSFYAPEYP